MAAAIAAHPSELGFFANRVGFGSPLDLPDMPMDGIARGARILLSDVAGSARCTINALVEVGGNVDPGNLAVRLGEVIANPQGDQIHLATLPFGHPSNFSSAQFLLSNGTYNDSAVDLDTFLWNNQDFMIFMPAGNNGSVVGPTTGFSTPLLPDYFNGTSLEDTPSNPQPIQIAAPATAKNLIAVGASFADLFTAEEAILATGGRDFQNAVALYTSRGPATEASLRMAPLVTAPQTDWFGFPLLTSTVAVFRSRDNDNLVPIEAQLDEGNFGTSFAAAYISGLGALIRDYFAQGFYPTSSRVTENRLPNVSGALVKALIAASADFNELVFGSKDTDPPMRSSRCLNLGTVAGASVGIMCNSEQGYGRAVGTHVLPLSNWPDNFQLQPTPSPEHVREYPAAGLLIYDHLATGEVMLDNSTTSVSHTFTVESPASIDLDDTLPGGRVVTRSNLRVALSWPDLPGIAGAGGTLINDLDLVLQSPGTG